MCTPALSVELYTEISVLVYGHKGQRISSWVLEGTTMGEEFAGGQVFAPLSSQSVNAAGGASDAIALSLGSGEVRPVIFRVLEPITHLRAVTGGVGDAETLYVVSVLMQSAARR